MIKTWEGDKGYIQLAIRSGQYKKLNVLAIKEGELIRFDPLNEEIEVRLIEDEEVREDTPTIGYYAMFEYTNGFRKAIYWSKKKMEAHALKYSKGYAAKRGFTFWEKDFDAMAYKTMLRQLISRWGIMSIDMQKAMEGDMAVINENGAPVYVDNEPEAPEAIMPEPERKPIEQQTPPEPVEKPERKPVEKAVKAPTGTNVPEMQTPPPMPKRKSAADALFG
jgi:recombination protein RecT